MAGHKTNVSKKKMSGHKGPGQSRHKVKSKAAKPAGKASKPPGRKGVSRGKKKSK